MSGVQYTICDDCGKNTLPHNEAVWTGDGASYCPTCRPKISGATYMSPTEMERRIAAMVQEGTNLSSIVDFVLREAAAVIRSKAPKLSGPDYGAANYTEQQQMREYHRICFDHADAIEAMRPTSSQEPRT